MVFKIKKRNFWSSYSFELKFEFVCVAIAPGGLDGYFGFGVKAVALQAAKRGLKGKKGMLVLAYQRRTRVVRNGILEEKKEKKNSFTSMTANWYSSPTPLQMPSQLRRQGRSTPRCKKGG